MHTDEVTERIIGCAFNVQNVLGAGFLEKVYENALSHALRKAGLKVSQQPAVKVFFDGVCVGDYCPDLMVESQVIVELKHAKAIGPEHEAQLLNYLRATDVKVGLILNFGTPKSGIKRMVF